MLRARSNSSKRDFSGSLVHSVTSYLACGPLKRPEVMSALLGRPTAPAQKQIYVRGYELVMVTPNRSEMPKRKNPIFIPNPADFNVASFALYSDITERELRIIARYNGVGFITEASLETSAFGNHSSKHLIHRLRAGTQATQYYFPTEEEVFDEYEMEHLSIDDYAKEAAKFKKLLDQQLLNAEGALPPQSRK